MSTMTNAQRMQDLKAKIKAHQITQKMVAHRSGYERDYIKEVLSTNDIGDFALNAIEQAVEQLIKADTPIIKQQMVIAKQHTIVSEMCNSVQTTMLVMHHFKYYQTLTSRQLSKMMFENGRDIGIRQSQRVLQKMCEGGLLLQARHSDTSMPIEYSLTQAARELMTGGAA